MNSRALRMDNEFDRFLIDMKPYILKLNHKTDKQRCALWIKKLCQPIGSSLAKKNRNLYARLLLLMLKRGSLEGPFATNPNDGPLSELPSYMSIFMDDSYESKSSHMLHSSPTNTMAQWADKELNESLFPADRSYPFPSSSPERNRYLSTRDLNNHDDSFMLPEPPIGGSRRSQPFTREGKNFHERDFEMKTKFFEARFHEEKLNLQHEHDVAVQKILDRKNLEIDEVKTQYKNKEKEHEVSKRKQEKRISTLQQELQSVQQRKNRQIEEVQHLLTETSEKMKSDFEMKMQDLASKMEREKYELQKSHTKNIQSLLDDTNQRLACMEEEYSSQSQATKLVISELEGRVSELTRESESILSSRQLLLHEKEQMQSELDHIALDLEQACTKLRLVENELSTANRDHKIQIETVTEKSKVDLEHLKQEHERYASKCNAQLRELEDNLQSAKHSLQDIEQQRVRDIREKESLHQQDVMSIQHLNEKQVHALKTEFEQEKSQLSRKLRSLEETIKERDEQIVQLTKQQKQTAIQTEESIESFKKQASEARLQLYNEMNSKLQKIEGDLDESHKSKAKLINDHQKEVEEQSNRHSDEMQRMKDVHEQEKVLFSEKASRDYANLKKDFEDQLTASETRLKERVKAHENLLEERQQEHQKAVEALEVQLRDSRQDLVSANASRRQQLVELGLLREEERQKMSQDHDAAVVKLETEMDRQRMEQHKQHASEIEKMTENMKSKLEAQEANYKSQLERCHERISDGQRREKEVKLQLVELKREFDDQILLNAQKNEDDLMNLKAHHQALLCNVQADLETERERVYLSQRERQKQEFDLKDHVNKVKLQYEEQMQGMLPKSVKEDFEETIACLKSQIITLQQKVNVLEDSTDELLNLSSLRVQEEENNDDMNS